MLRYLIAYLLEHRVQLAKFAIVGFVTFAINFFSFHLFFDVLFRLDYRIAVSLAYVTTVLCHFSLHRIFTFEATEQQFGRNVAKYLVMLAVNYVITLTIVWLSVEIAGLSPYIGVVASTAATAWSSFFLMKYVVFRANNRLWQVP